MTWCNDKVHYKCNPVCGNYESISKITRARLSIIANTTETERVYLL